jgi:hypothetical protein
MTHLDDDRMPVPFRLNLATSADGDQPVASAGRMVCMYCGSLHPQEVAALIASGTTLTLAPQTHGPHKATVGAHGKFFTKHLLDATPAQRETIEQALGLRITYGPDRSLRGKPI